MRRDDCQPLGAASDYEKTRGKGWPQATGADAVVLWLPDRYGLCICWKAASPRKQSRPMPSKSAGRRLGAKRTPCVSRQDFRGVGPATCRSLSIVNHDAAPSRLGSGVRQRR